MIRCFSFSVAAYFLVVILGTRAKVEGSKKGMANISALYKNKKTLMNHSHVLFKCMFIENAHSFFLRSLSFFLLSTP